MNRKQRRARKSITTKRKYSLEDVQRAMNIALEIRKLTKGHLYRKDLKDKCVFCGATMKTRSLCKFWFLSFMDRIQVVLINPDYFTDQEIEALYIYNGQDYGQIRLPLESKSAKKA